MADVKLNIAGRVYDVHCADGQEAQLLNLASLVDAKIRTMPGGTEIRQMLFAALMLADEAQDANGIVEKTDSLRAAIALAESREAQARDELKAALSELEALKKAPAAESAPRPSHDRALLQIADRIETLAAKVEQIP